MNYEKKRSSSFELVKVIAMIFIICSSALPYGLTYGGGYDEIYVNLTETEFSFQHILFTLFRWMGQIGDALFVGCSAWFLCDSKSFKAQKLIKMVMDTILISWIGLAIAMFFVSPTIGQIVKALLPITFQQNWFVGCYIIYYLIHPLLNKASSDLTKPQLMLLSGMLFVAYSLISVVIPGRYYYSNLVGFICIHYYVMCTKRCLNEKIDLNMCRIISASAFIILGVFIMLQNYLGNILDTARTRNLYFCTYINPLIIIMALSVICLAAFERNFESRFVNRFSSFSLLVYLFHANYFWLTYGKYWLLQKMVNLGISEMESVLLLIVAYIIFLPIMSGFYEMVFGKATLFISSMINSKISYLVEKNKMI